MSRPSITEPALKVAEDLRGVKKGSRILPLLVVVAIVVGFVAYAVERPPYAVQLITVEHGSEVPEAGKNLMVIAREGLGGPWHFRLFDRRGKQVATITDESQSANDEVSQWGLEGLKKVIKDSHWDQALPSELIAGIPQLFPLVTLPKFWYWNFPASVVQDTASDFAREFLADYPAVLRSQLLTIWVVALYSLAPGFFGMIYRRAFWTWFTGAFLVLFTIDWGFNAINYGSVAPVYQEIGRAHVELQSL